MAGLQILAIWALLPLAIRGQAEDQLWEELTTRLAVRPGAFSVPGRTVAMDRSLELRVKGHLYEITAVNDDVLDTRRGLPSAIEGYRKTLESVAEAAGADMVDAVATDIKEHIRSEGDRPDNHSLRRETQIRLANEDIVPPEYLNRA